MHADHPVSGHLDDERLAAFVDGALDGDERAAAELHLAACDACRVAVAEIVRTVEGLEAEEGAFGRRTPVDLGGAVVRRSTGRRGWLYGAAGLAAAAALVLAVWMPRGERPELRELVEAVGERRPVEGRLTGGFRYGPLESPTRGAEASTDWRVLAAAGRLDEDARGTEDARLLGALGTAHLVTRQFDEAVKYFDQAIDIAPDDVLLRSDRAAALLARGDAAGDDGAADYVRALDDATRAVLKDPTRREAVFNKALALQRMHLVDQELEVWRAYLALDDRSAWADVARTRIAAIETVKKSRSRWRDRERDAVIDAADRGDRPAVERAARDFAEHVRALVEDEALPAWAESAIRGDRASSERWLCRSRELAGAVERVNGDRLAADAVRAAGPGVAEGYAAWGRARRFYAGDRVGDARMEFERAAVMLGMRNPVGLAADFYAHVTRFVAREYEDMEVRFARVAYRAGRARYPTLAGAAERMRGLIFSHDGNPLRALDSHQRSLAWYRQVGEAQGIGGSLASIAESYRLLGRSREAWTASRGAIDVLDRASPRRRQSAYVSAAQTALNGRLPGAAAAFQVEAVRAAEEWGLDGPLAESLTLLARIRAASGDYAGVEDAVAAARRRLAGRATSHATILADVDVAAAERPGLSASTRRAALDRALALWQTSNHTDRLPRLYLRRASTWDGPDRVLRAASDLDRGLEIFEQSMSRQGAGVGVSYLDEAWGLFESRIRLEAEERQDSDAALRVWERGKARVLLARLGVATEGDPIGDVQSAIDAVTVVLCYAVVDGRVLAWGISDREVVFRKLDVTEAALRRLIDRQPTDRPEGAWAALHDSLLRPFASLLEASRHLVIIGDVPITRVGFAGLYDRQASRFLIEDHTIQIAPGLRAFAALTRAAATFNSTPSRVLAIAAPEPVPALGLPGLPQALSEVLAVEALYPRVVRAVGTSAEDVVNGLSRAEIFHFAGHAIANEDYPGLSLLVLGPNGGAAQTLTAERLRQAPPFSMRLAVLSACSTAAGFSSRGEGVLGVVQPFFDRGTPGVVASLWPLTDSTGLGVATRFHMAYSRGATPAEAMRLAQLPLVNRQRSPFEWAGLSVFGT